MKLFEIRVKVGQKLKSYHLEENSHKQAAQRAKKHGRVIDVKKVDRTQLIGNIENLNLEQGDYLGEGIYEGNLDIDSILGLSQKKKDRRSKIERERQYRTEE